MMKLLPLATLMVLLPEAVVLDATAATNPPLNQSAGQRGHTGIAYQHVVGGTAGGNRVVASTAEDQIEAATDADRVVAARGRACGDRGAIHATVVTKDQIVATAARDVISAGTTEDDVDSRHWR
jgi:hypothetical protein